MTRKIANVTSILLALTPIAAAFLAMIIIFFAKPALPRDFGQWEATPKEVRDWVRRQMQPDYPSVSCCGEADGYHSDSVAVEGQKVFAIITDTRDDGPLGRPHVPVGTRIEVPVHKNKDSRGDPNPTGHGFIFLNNQGDVICYIGPSGV